MPPVPKNDSSRSTSVAGACFALLGAAAGCNSIFGIDTFVAYDGGATGGASSSSATGASVSASVGSTSSTGGSGGKGGTGGAGGKGGSGGAGGAAKPTAVHLDGSTGFISFPNTTTLTPTGGFTWELWYNADNPPTTTAKVRAQTFFSVLTAAPCQDIYLGFGSEESPGNAITFLVDGPGDCNTRELSPPSIVPSGGAGTWHFVAAAINYANKLERLYVDGTMVTHNFGGANGIPDANVVRAGHWSDGTGSPIAWFQGSLDEIRVYSTALSDATIQAHYAGGMGTHGMTNEASLVAGWHLDEGKQTAATDYQGAESGTLMGGATWVPGHVPAQ